MEGVESDLPRYASECRVSALMAGAVGAAGAMCLNGFLGQAGITVAVAVEGFLPWTTQFSLPLILLESFTRYNNDLPAFCFISIQDLLSGWYSFATSLFMFFFTVQVGIEHDLEVSIFSSFFFARDNEGLGAIQKALCVVINDWSCVEIWV